jgi:pSer/pThr/pTyr-binding forkhead associated (FHA) protein
VSHDPQRERLRSWARRTASAVDARVDRDALRGWTERHDPDLRRPHALPPLVTLESDEGAHQTLHAPRVLIGRFSPQHGPVDLVPALLYDHELYRVSAPHALVELTSAGWTVRAVSPRALTRLGQRELTPHDGVAPLSHGDTLTLGVTSWRVLLHDDARADWERAREALLGSSPEPALFLSRAGGICGPRFPLPERRAHVLGRAFSLDTPDPPTQPDWDLCGLPEHERRYVAFRHAELRPLDAHDWEVAPLSPRHKVYVNRVPIDDPVLLHPGDELGLGALTFLFHHPAAEAPPARPEPDLPAVVDWTREHTRPRDRPDASSGAHDEEAP